MDRRAHRTLDPFRSDRRGNRPDQLGETGRIRPWHGLCARAVVVERLWPVESRIDILREVRAQDPCSTVPCVTPGGELLLRLSGWPKVEAALRFIDTVESDGIAPEEVCPDHWRHVHNRLTAALEPRAYTPARHAAWLKRRMIMT